MIVGRQHTERTGRVVGTDEGGPLRLEGRAPCVVCVHGFTGTTSEVRPLAEAIGRAGYAVHAPLLPGHGDRPDRLQDTTFRDWRSAVAQELEVARRRHGHVVLCGFSLGSLLVMDVARGRPEGLSGIMVLGNALTLARPLSAAFGFVDRRGWSVPDWYLLKLWPPDMRDRGARRRLAAYDRDPLRAALEVYRAGRRVEERLAEITCPVFVAHGAKDRVCPARNAERLRMRVGSRRVTLRIYERSGHLIAADVERDELAADALDFLRDIESV